MLTGLQAPSNTPYRLQLDPRVDFALDITGVCERKRFDLAAHERPDVGRGHQHRPFALACGGLEGVALPA